MKHSPKLFAIPLLICSAEAAVASSPTPTATMPESYSEFFPSLSHMPTHPSMLLPGDGSISLTDVAKPRKLPRLLNASGTRPEIESDIFGYLYYFSDQNLNQGMYRIDPSKGASFMWTDAYTDQFVTMTGGWLRNGRLCGLNSLKSIFGTLAYGQIELDLQTGEVFSWRQLRFGDDLSNVYMTTAYRDLDDHVYGYSYSEDGYGYGFSSAPADNIDATKIIIEAPSSDVCKSLCYNVQDDLFYGVTLDGRFVSVDIEGKQTTIFRLDLADMRNSVSGIVYSPSLQAYVWNAYFTDGSSALYAIDAEKKTATLLLNCLGGENYTYFVTTAPNALPDAPASPGFVSSDFADGALSGSVAFTMPSMLLNGTEIAEGTKLGWNLLIDGNPAGEGEALAAQTVEIPTEALSTGFHTFAFSASLLGNRSVPATFMRWIGDDVPMAPKEVELSESCVKWNAVSEGCHAEFEGYLNPEAISYKVSLNGEFVGETSTTEMEITLPSGLPYSVYQAEVKAVFHSFESEPGVSNPIAFGDPLTLNPSIHFRPEEEEFALFKTFDLDGRTDEAGNTRNWHFSTTMGFPSFASGADGDDLLIFPPIEFDDASHSYAFEMEAGLIHDRDNTGTIEVLFGDSPTPEAMTRVIIPPTQLFYMRGIVMKEYFAVPSPGVYYIGIRTHTNEVAFHVSDIDIARSDKEADLPVSVSDLEAVAGANGALSATVSFTMPTLNAAGSEIDPSRELTATVVSRNFIPGSQEPPVVTETKTVTGKPGSRQSLEIATVQNYNTIGVACSFNGNPGAEASVNIYTGLVPPYTVNDFTVRASADNMSALISWTPPTEGEEEGEIGDSFFYTVWYYDDGWQFLDGIGYDVCETEVNVPADSDQQYYILGVMAMNAAGQSDHIASRTVVLGPPYQLPMMETLPDGMPVYEPIMTQRPSKEYDSTFWMVDDPAEIHPMFACPDGLAFVGYIGYEGINEAMGRVSLPKFSTIGEESCNVTLRYWDGDYAAQFMMLANIFDADEPLSVGSFAKTGKGWTEHTLELPEDVMDRGWVELLLDAKFTSTYDFAMFSGYSIYSTTGVKLADASGEEAIFTSCHMIHIAGYRGDAVSVYDMNGIKVAGVASAGDIEGFVVSPGVYVVNAGQSSTKVIVK